MTIETITAAAKSAADNQSLANFQFNLPPFPTTASQLVAELNNADVQVPKVTQLIECEPTVGAKVISLANSPLYGTTRPISTIGHAIVILGFRSVSQLALTVATASVFKNGPSQCADACQKTYTQSLAIATVARLIAGQTTAVNADEAFLSGVMHDVGKLILFDTAGADYAKLLGDHPAGNTTGLEHETYGITHSALGKACGKKWGMPHCINVAISNHHATLAEVSDPLSETLITANYFARKWQVGFEPGEDVEVDGLVESSIADTNEANLQDQCVEQFAALQEICLT